MKTSMAARTARGAFNEVLGSRAGGKTVKAVHHAAVAELERKARAWDELSAVLTENGNECCSAADVCEVGFAIQEQLAS